MPGFSGAEHFTPETQLIGPNVDVRFRASSKVCPMTQLGRVSVSQQSPPPFSRQFAVLGWRRVVGYVPS